MQGLQEEACKETGRRMGRETRRGRIRPLSFVLSPPPQPHCINGAACIPLAALFSLSCIIRTQYNLFFFYINCNLKNVYEYW